VTYLYEQLAARRRVLSASCSFGCGTSFVFQNPKGLEDLRYMGPTFLAGAFIPTSDDERAQIVVSAKSYANDLLRLYSSLFGFDSRAGSAWSVQSLTQYL
jgi:hypothetical protein